MDEDINQDEIIIRCKNIDENILEIQDCINQIISRDLKMILKIDWKR